ncbi:MarR family winged helix-turn-helix transcriptional regulator [Cribrihabitans sp. XS_ASV171]
MEQVATALDSLVGYNLKRAYIILQNDFRAALGHDGLSTRGFSALSLVVENPEITQSELARRLGIERSGLVAIVDDLEGRGYLARKVVPGDRRVQALVPTEQGHAAHDAALEAIQAQEAWRLSGFSGAERMMLLDFLSRIRNTDVS